MAKYLLVYDTDCGPCNRFRNAVDWLDKYNRLEYVSLHGADELGLLDRIPKNRRHRSFHLISPAGKLSSGSYAIPILVTLFPLGRCSAALINKAPRGQNIVNFVYTTLSRLHDDGSCSYQRATSSKTGARKTEKSMSRRGLDDRATFSAKFESQKPGIT